LNASLDRVIANLRRRLNGSPPDAMTELLAAMVERGEIDAGTAKSIRAAHRNMLERMKSMEETR